MNSLLPLVLACSLTSPIVLSIPVLGSKLQLSSPNVAPPQYNVTFYTKAAYYPKGLFFNHTIYQNGSSANYPAGNYTAEAMILLCPPPACASFEYWNSTGGVEVAEPNHYMTNVSVIGSGSLTAEYYVYPPSPIQSGSILLAVATTLILLTALRRRRERLAILYR